VLKRAERASRWEENLGAVRVSWWVGSRRGLFGVWEGWGGEGRGGGWWVEGGRGGRYLDAMFGGSGVTGEERKVELFLVAAAIDRLFLW